MQPKKYSRAFWCTFWRTFLEEPTSWRTVWRTFWEGPLSGALLVAFCSLFVRCFALLEVEKKHAKKRKRPKVHQKVGPSQKARQKVDPSKSAPEGAAESPAESRNLRDLFVLLVLFGLHFFCFFYSAFLVVICVASSFLGCTVCCFFP